MARPVQATKSELLHTISKIRGYLRDDEAQLLYALGKQAKKQGVIVEIGSWEGKSTVCLAKGSMAGNKVPVYAIDPHTGSCEHTRTFGKVDTYRSFTRNIKSAGVDELVSPLVMTSHAAVEKVKEKASLLFIDGAHDYDSVKQDYQDWYPKLISGGIIAFHDTVSWPGPKQVVARYIFPSRHIRNVKVIGSITYGEKTASITWWEFAANQYVLLMKHIRGMLLELRLPRPVHEFAKKIYYRLQ